MILKDFWQTKLGQYIHTYAPTVEITLRETTGSAMPPPHILNEIVGLDDIYHSSTSSEVKETLSNALIQYEDWHKKMKLKTYPKSRSLLPNGKMVSGEKVELPIGYTLAGAIVVGMSYLSLCRFVPDLHYYVPKFVIKGDQENPDPPTSFLTIANLSDM